MNCIKNQLACGNIIVDSKNCMATFTVSKISDLFGKIIPFFSKYPRIPLWTILVHKGQDPNILTSWIFVK